MILLNSLEILPLLTAALVTALVLIVTKCIAVDRVLHASNWKLVAMIAASFGMAAGLER